MSDLAVMVIAVLVFTAWLFTVAYWAQVQAIKAMYKQQEERDERGKPE